VGFERDHLRSGHIRDALRDSPIAPELLSDAQLEDSLAAVLRANPDPAETWVFAYGALVWSRSIRFAERRTAVAHGYHRRFCLRSRINRGTAESPGLVLGLDRGGRCAGLACRLAPENAREELRLVWRQEMMTGAYLPRWLEVTTDTGRLWALAFVVDRRAAGYAGRLADEAVVETLRTARGLAGRGSDYLRRTAEALRAHGIRDAYLERLAGQLESADRSPVRR
jgi:cation transport protein ChaC